MQRTNDGPGLELTDQAAPSSRSSAGTVSEVNRPWAGREMAIRLHDQRLQRLAVSLTSNVHDARDLVQDTLERSLRRLPAGLSPDRTQRWLMVTLRNCFIDRCRSLEHRRYLLVGDSKLQQVPQGEAEEEPAWSNVDEHQLHRCIDRLPPALREVFLRRTRYRQSQAQIASELGISVTTVGTRYFRARLQLRKMLEREAN